MSEKITNLNQLARAMVARDRQLNPVIVQAELDQAIADATQQTELLRDNPEFVSVIARQAFLAGLRLGCGADRLQAFTAVVSAITSASANKSAENLTTWKDSSL